eukprot:CAMPEP_0194519004 /NCGR_PEP_ID=MMETSP0253-20130528/52533_1 /TAXON_ID=2966 /ORGANISM="Noctiluca scintillans" /LENGTH=138 /DNA_ID=CAMNT_0039363089 /DNA_START=215 /DNA_END=631 /DNA_ORIENTATION=+
MTWISIKSTPKAHNAITEAKTYGTQPVKSVFDVQAKRLIAKKIANVATTASSTDSHVKRALRSPITTPCITVKTHRKMQFIGKHRATWTQHNMPHIMTMAVTATTYKIHRWPQTAESGKREMGAAINMATISCTVNTA